MERVREGKKHVLDCSEFYKLERTPRKSVAVPYVLHELFDDIARLLLGGFSMPVVWCSISAHGFGHAAQVIPVLNTLGEVVPDLKVILRTCVEPSIFQENLRVNWELQAVPQDIGCIQEGPLAIDIAGTWAAHQAFHDNWTQRVEEEVRDMEDAGVDLVLSNISYLAIASACQANRLGVAIASLSWDQVLAPFMEATRADHRAIYEHIRQQYMKTTHLIRLYPAIAMPIFPSSTETGPSFSLAAVPSQNLRKLVGIQTGEKLVLIAFGGVPLTSLPLKEMERCEGFHFLVGGMVLDGSWKRVHCLENILMPFGEMLKQADVVMTKPGYGTVVTAVHHGIPLVYVRRNNFVDEQSLVDYAHQHGRALELTHEAFRRGVWKETLEAVLALPDPLKPSPQPDCRGIVRVLRRYLKA